MGTAALSDKDYIHDAIRQADLIIAVGHDTFEKPTHMRADCSGEFIHVNFYPAVMDEMYTPTLEVV